MNTFIPYSKKKDNLPAAAGITGDLIRNYITYMNRLIIIMHDSENKDNQNLLFIYTEVMHEKS